MKTPILLLAACAVTGFAAEPAAAYPLATCIVSGDKLTEMGGPVKFVYNGREIQFCCKDCIKEFKASPDKFLAKLDAATKAKAAKK